MENNVRNSKLNKSDLLLINNILNEKKTYNKIEDIEKLRKKEILILIEDKLSKFIGYDMEKKDIDKLGEQVDEIISKLLQFLEKRGDL